eukprot:scaffold3801_cov124-Isochrysis_galbana.AAC.3
MCAGRMLMHTKASSWRADPADARCSRSPTPTRHQSVVRRAILGWPSRLLRQRRRHPQRAQPQVCHVSAARPALHRAKLHRRKHADICDTTRTQTQHLVACQAPHVNRMPAQSPRCPISTTATAAPEFRMQYAGSYANTLLHTASTPAAPHRLAPNPEPWSLPLHRGPAETSRSGR